MNGIMMTQDGLEHMLTEIYREFARRQFEMERVAENHNKSVSELFGALAARLILSPVER